MKYVKIIFYMLPLLIGSGNVYSQWLQQTSGGSQGLYDVEFLNEMTGWMTGDGVIYKTTNGGNNWISQQCPTPDRPLNNIHIVNSNVAYIAGWFETVLKTTDGGTNWMIMRTAPWGQGTNKNAIFFINENTGWVAGNGQQYLKTTDGGQNFSEHFISSNEINDMYFKDTNTGLMMGSATSMQKTTDAGESWRNIELPSYPWDPEMFKLSIVHDSLGWVVGSGNSTVFKTTNFGDNWSLIDTIDVSGQGLFNPEIALMQCIRFVDANTGFAGAEQGKLYKSTDGGYSWRRENSGTFSPSFISSIFLINIPGNKMNPTGWACGGAGKIIKTTNGGQTYVEISENGIMPVTFELSQNYPNPFNPKTNIKFQIAQPGFVTLHVYDMAGKTVKELVNEYKNPGSYTVSFDGSGLGSGVYFYRLKTNTFSNTKRMVLVK